MWFFDGCAEADDGEGADEAEGEGDGRLDERDDEAGANGDEEEGTAEMFAVGERGAVADIDPVDKVGHGSGEEHVDEDIDGADVVQTGH